jgi:hypothetical protein
LRRALGDDGVPGQLLEAWEQADARAARMRFH